MKILGKTTRPAHIDSVPHFVEFVTGHTRNVGFHSDRIQEIELSLKEALDNILFFSYKKGGFEIMISCNSDNAGRFVIIISDNGKPFNALLETAPFMTLEASITSDQKPSTKIMKRFIRNIEYKRFENKNILTFTVSRVKGHEKSTTGLSTRA